MTESYLPDQSKRVLIAATEELPPGTRKLVDVGGRSLGVFNVNGEYRAVLNICPHAFAPICLGPVRGTTQPSTEPGQYRWYREGEILACPWHGWEFHLLSGESLVDRRRLKLFPVEVEDDKIYVIIPSK